MSLRLHDETALPVTDTRRSDQVRQTMPAAMQLAELLESTFDLPVECLNFDRSNQV